MAPTIKLTVTDEQKRRLNFLAKHTKKNRDHFLNEIIKNGIEDAENRYLSPDQLEALHKDLQTPASDPDTKITTPQKNNSPNKKQHQNQQNTETDWNKFAPSIMTDNLIDASLFLTIFEYTKDVIKNNIKSIYSDMKKGLVLTFKSQEFKEHILALLETNEQIKSLDEKYNKQEQNGDLNLHNALLWLLDAEAITPDDIEIIKQSEKERNKIAHELPSLLTQKNKSINLPLLIKLIQAFEKIERWHAVNYDFAALYPEIDFQGKQNSITPGSIIFISLLINVIMYKIDYSSVGKPS